MKHMILGLNNAAFAEPYISQSTMLAVCGVLATVGCSVLVYWLQNRQSKADLSKLQEEVERRKHEFDIQKEQEISALWSYLEEIMTMIQIAEKEAHAAPFQTMSPRDVELPLLVDSVHRMHKGLADLYRSVARSLVLKMPITSIDEVEMLVKLGRMPRHWARRIFVQSFILTTKGLGELIEQDEQDPTLRAVLGELENECSGDVGKFQLSGDGSDGE